MSNNLDFLNQIQDLSQEFLRDGGDSDLLLRVVKQEIEAFEEEEGEA